MDYGKFPHQRGTPSGQGERQARHLDTLGTPSLHRVNPDGSVSRKVNGRLYVDPAPAEQAQTGLAGYEFWVNEDFRQYPEGLGSAGELGVAPTDADGVEIPGEPVGDYAKGSAVFLSMAGKALPRYSTTLVPEPGQVPTWNVVPARRATSVTPSNGAKAEPDYFYTKWSWQDQKMAEHSWWKGNKGDWLLTSAIGFNYGLATNAPQRGPGTTAYSFRSNYLLKLGADRQNDPVMGDAGFDIKTCAYKANGVQVGASRQQGEKVWYRRAAVQTVTLPSGARRDYVIQSDTHGRFTVWPLGEYQNAAKYAELYAANPIAYADLPPSVARVFLPPYPGWVTVPDTAQDVETQHWTWQFNKTGTRCATVAHQKVEAWVWVWTKTNAGDPFGPYYLVGGKPLMPDAHFNNLYTTQNAGNGYQRSAPGREANGAFRPDPDGDGWAYRRVREYRLPRRFGEQTFARAYLIDGVLVGCSQEAGFNPVVGGSTKDWKAVPNPENYEPAFTYLPGLLELGITVTATSESDPYAFDVTFDVLQSEFYDATSERPKRYFVDAAYYVATPRTKEQDAVDGLADDDLVVAEVEVYFIPGQGVTDEGPGFPTDPVGGNTWRYLTAGVQYAQGGRHLRGIVGPPGFASGRRYHDHIDEPYLESALTGQFRADGVHAYYMVRNQRTQAMVQRLCLVHNERWEFDGLDVLTEFFYAGPDTDRAFEQENGETVGYPGRVFMPLSTTTTSPQFEIGLARAKYLSENHMPATFVTHIDVADLRFLNFITRTYQRNRATATSYERLVVDDPNPHLEWNATRASRRFGSQVYPNHHLRIRGQAVRSILYQSDIPEFGPDPAATMAPPADAVRLPSIPRGEAPCGNEGATLAMQQEFAARFITPGLLPGNSIPAHPGGHWAACINRTQGEILFEGPEEVPTATGELISPLSGSTEGALNWFDAIHVHGKQDTTHKAVFNAAFGQDRDYSYWSDPDGTDEEEEFGGFMAGALWVKN